MFNKDWYLDIIMDITEKSKNRYQTVLPWILLGYGVLGQTALINMSMSCFPLWISPVKTENITKRCIQIISWLYVLCPICQECDEAVFLGRAPRDLQLEMEAHAESAHSGMILRMAIKQRWDGGGEVLLEGLSNVVVLKRFVNCQLRIWICIYIYTFFLFSPHNH